MNEFGSHVVFSLLERLLTYQCACCERLFAEARYVDGAFYCRECARGEHRHPGWGTKL